MTGPTTTPLPIATGRQTRAEFAVAMRGRWTRFAGIVVVLLVAAAAGLITPAALGGIVDAIANGETEQQIWLLGGLIAVGALIYALFTGIGAVATPRLFETLLARLRERMVANAVRLPQSTVEAAGTGDLISRAGDDVSQVSAAVSSVIPALSQSAFTIVMTFAGMAVVDWRYALALLVILPVHILTVRWYLRTAPQIYAAERAAMAERAHHLLASLHGLRAVHAYRLGTAHSTRIAAASWQAVRWAMRTRIVQNRFFGRLNLAEYLGMTAILLVGFVMVTNDLGTIGGATTAMLLFLRLFDPINELLFVFDEMQAATASLNRIVGVIRAEPAPEPPAPEPAAPAEPVLTVTDLDFGYQADHPVLHGVNLTLDEGQHLALVGTSGAGKTTLAAIIAGIHTADGTVTHRVTDTEHHRQVALVTQEVHVFSGTVRDNLTLARPDADTEQLREALERVGATAMVDALPDGLDTVVGSQGHRLTTADAQHLALARLVLADPVLAVLDEATAEAGSATSARLERATDGAIAGRTAIVVAHRLTQAARSDRVLVMESGRIVEDGSHTALSERTDGRYARLWRAWSRRQDRSGGPVVTPDPADR